MRKTDRQAQSSRLSAFDSVKGIATRAAVLTLVYFSLVLPGLTAKADARSCDAVLQESPQPLIEVATSLKPLRERMKEAVRDKKDPLKVVLKSDEKEILFQPALQVLKGLKPRISRLARLKSEIESRTNDLISAIQDSKKVTYGTSLRLAYEAASLASKVVALPESGNLTEDQFLAFVTVRKWPALESSIRKKISKDELIPILTDRGFSIRDFNSLLGSHMVPVGVRSRFTDADNFNFRPGDFFVYDIDRFRSSHESELKRKQWKKVLSAVDEMDADEQAAAHVLIFYMVYESTGFRGKFKEEKRTSIDWFNLEFNLAEENYYGEQRLKDVRDIRELLKSAARKLDRALK